MNLDIIHGLIKEYRVSTVCYFFKHDIQTWKRIKHSLERWNNITSYVVVMLTSEIGKLLYTNEKSTELQSPQGICYFCAQSVCKSHYSM